MAARDLLAGRGPRDLIAEKQGGLGNNLVAGSVETVTDTPGLVADLGAAASAGESGYTLKPLPGGGYEQVPGVEPHLVGRDLTHSINQSLDPVGLNPEGVVATTDAEKLVRKVGNFLPAALGGEASLLTRLERVLFPAAGSEALKGAGPVGEVVGALAGGGLSAVQLAERAVKAGRAGFAGARDMMTARDMTPGDRALQLVMKDLENDKVSLENAVQAVEHLGNEGQAPVALMDVGGPNLTRRARMVNTLPGEGMADLSKFLSERQLDQRNRILSNIEKSLADGSDVFATTERLTGEQRTATGPLYKGAFKANQNVSSPEIDSILATDAGQLALKDAARKMRNDRELVGIPDAELRDQAYDTGSYVPIKGVASGLKLRTLDYVKRALGDQIEAAQRAGSGDVSILTRLKKDLVSELDRLDTTNPVKAERAKLTKVVPGANIVTGDRLSPAESKELREAVRIWDKPSDPVPSEVRLIPLDKVVNTQSYVQKAGTNSYVREIEEAPGNFKGFAEPPEVYKFKGEYIVEDGHHRIEAARARSIKALPMKVMDLDEAMGGYEPPKGLYAQARAAHAEPEQIKDVIQQGTEFVKIRDYKKLKSIVDRLPPALKPYYRMAAASKLREMLTTTRGNPIDQVHGTITLREQIKAVFGDEAAGKFSRQITSERVMDQSNKAVNRGSNSVDKAADLAETSDIPGAAKRVITGAIHGGVRGALWAAADIPARVTSFLTSLTPEVRSEISRLLRETDSNSLSGLINRPPLGIDNGVAAPGGLLSRITQQSVSNP